MRNEEFRFPIFGFCSNSIILEPHEKTISIIPYVKGSHVIEINTTTKGKLNSNKIIVSHMEDLVYSVEDCKRVFLKRVLFIGMPNKFAVIIR